MLYLKAVDTEWRTIKWMYEYMNEPYQWMKKLINYSMNELLNR